MRHLFLLLPAVIAAPLAAATLEAQVERTAPDRVDIRWTGSAGKPVDIYLSPRPDAGAAQQRLLVKGDTDGSATVSVPTDARPYFRLQPKGEAGHWVAERLLPLEGGRNFRDLGGYRTADGRHVKWGLLYRSGSMGTLTEGDKAYLDRLGIRAICDFRTTPERQDDPNLWAKTAAIPVLSRDYDMSGGDLRQIFASGATPEKARAAMIATYRSLPYEQADAYRDMFAQLLKGDVPLAFNCSAGKDRTGVAAALILTALGVPRETVFADYGLTNRYLPEALKRSGAAKDPALSRIPAELLQPVLAADPAYLQTAFDAIAARNGSVEAYLKDVLGIGPAETASLRRQLLD